MKDRYLFKVKREDTKEWIIGNVVVNNKDVHFINLDGFMHIVDKKTICQCTGLKDSEGNLIFENDIILVKCKYLAEMKWKVIFDDYHNQFFILQEPYDKEINSYCSLVGYWNPLKRCKIIGNIHDKEATKQYKKKEKIIKQENEKLKKECPFYKFANGDKVIVTRQGVFEGDIGRVKRLSPFRLILNGRYFQEKDLEFYDKKEK